MGGINVYCGEFSGADKSCSAVEAVLEDLTPFADDAQRALLSELKERMFVGSDHALIEAWAARSLLPLLTAYREQIMVRITPIRDPFDQIAKDHDADPTLDATEAKYGGSLGWKLYCVLDLERAFLVATETGEPVALVRS